MGDYLETQRIAFARFYFIGDEDLLEIIGNSKDVTNVQRHFQKMYAGITSLENSENGDLITGMISKENELVNFVNPIRISATPQIHLWLTAVDNAMRTSLAQSLESCLAKLLKIVTLKSTMEDLQ